VTGTSAHEDRSTLAVSGAVRIPGPFAQAEQAWSEARAVIDEASGGEGSLDIIGEFVLPPADGPPSRDFQTLHFDFGLPLDPVVPADVARFTGLYMPADIPTSDAVTRLVPLGPLLASRPWPPVDELVRRFAAYGHSRGAWDDAAGYAEGSLARIVEAALGEPAALPSVKTHPSFLCGNEFASLADELEFFAERGLPLDAVEIDVRLGPGELLIFDNFRLAHGRRGTRRPGELNQRIFGHSALVVEQQLDLREAMLAAFANRSNTSVSAARLLDCRKTAAHGA
jgi:hypothetical protein